MKQYIVYDSATGAILRTGRCSDDTFYLQAGEGESVLGGVADDTRQKVNIYLGVLEDKPPCGLEEVKALALDRLAAARYAVETGGIELNGAHIDTDRVAQAQMAGALLSFQNGFVTETIWKTSGVWVPVNQSEMEAICAAVAEHVQACFAREKSLGELVQAATSVEEVEAVAW